MTIWCLRIAAALAIILPRSAPLFAASENRRMDEYRVGHYNLSIAFDLSRKTFSGRVGIRAVAVQRLRDMVLSASSRTLTIDSVVDRGRPAAFRHAGDYLTVGMKPRPAPSSPFNVVIYFHGFSTFKGAYDDGGVYFTPSGRIATSSEPSFAHTWWPCKDVPSNKATATIAISVPDSMTAVSNGVLQSVNRRGGIATYTWETHYPIATYLISVAAARYDEFQSTYTGLDGTRMPVTTYVFPEDLSRAKVDFEHTADILSYFARTFCEYPFIKEKFGFAEVEGDATMENQTICSIQNTLITGDRKGELTFVHETSHHWWGNLITPADWHHTWLNEGFATYAEALYLEHTAGREAYKQQISRLMSVPPGAYAGSVVGASDTAFWDSFAPRVYSKGALVLHMLRGLVGDSVFFTIMRNYLNDSRLRYGNARTGDFAAVCSRTAGTDLTWFFRQWVYASADSVDRPSLAYSWHDDGGQPPRSVTLMLRQQNAPALLYRLPLDIDVRSGESVRHFAVIDSLAQQTFSFPVPGPVTSLVIDKDGKLFMDLVQASPR